MADAREPEADVITAGRRHLLVDSGRAYEIRGRDPEGPVLASFSLTDEGLSDAEREFRRMERTTRWSTTQMQNVLTRTIFWALGLWLVSSVPEIIYPYLSGFDTGLGPGTVPFDIPEESFWDQAIKIVSIVSALTFRLWVSALIALATLRFLVPRADQ